MKKLAIIGASYLQLPLVQKAKEMGIETHCFAWEDGAVCRDKCDFFYPVSVLDKEAILEECRRIDIDGITTIATDIAVTTISYVATAMGLQGNTIETALKATNKGSMRRAFSDYGCSIPSFSTVGSIKEIDTNFNFPVIVKPVDRSGSRGVARVENQDMLVKAVENALSESISGTAIIEEYISGDEVSVETISHKGKHYILAITDKITTGEPYFVEIAHHEPSKLPAKTQEIILYETLKALDALGIENGAGHTEIKITPEGRAYIIETGARMGGDFIGSHLVQLTTGYDFLKGVIETALGTFTIPVIRNQNFSGVFFLSKETEELLPYFDNKYEFEIEKGMTGGLLKKIKNSNDRSGYFIYKSTKRLDLLNIK